MDTIVASAKKLLTIPVSFTYVYKDSTFHIGLGRETEDSSPVGFNYREYQIVTYESTWQYFENESGAYRRLNGAKSNDFKQSFSSLIGAYILAIVADQNSVMIRFNCGFSLLHYFSNSTFDEDVLSIFLPHDLCLGFSFKLGWRAGRSSDPWNDLYWKTIEASQMVIGK